MPIFVVIKNNFRLRNNALYKYMIAYSTRVLLLVSMLYGGSSNLFSQPIAKEHGSISVSAEHHSSIPESPIFWSEEHLNDTDDSTLFEKEEDTNDDSLVAFISNQASDYRHVNLFGGLTSKVCSCNSTKLFLLFCCLKLDF